MPDPTNCNNPPSWNLFLDFNLWYMYNLIMREIRFVWDRRKAEVNRKKHGVAFDEAQTVFCDEKARVISDPDHSGEEDRFIILGISSRLRILLVCHCYQADDCLIRNISARKATKKERKQYLEHLP